MEKIHNVKEWPEDVQQSLYAFAMGLRDDKSMVYCLDQHILEHIKYYLIRGVVYDRLPDTVPFFGGGKKDVVLGVFETDGPSFYSNEDFSTLFIECDSKKIHRKYYYNGSGNGDLLFFTGPQIVFYKTLEIQLAVFLTHCHLYPDDEMDVKQRLYALLNSCGYFVLKVDGDYRCITVLELPRKEIPLYCLLENRMPRKTIRAKNCEMEPTSLLINVHLEECRERPLLSCRSKLWGK